MSDNVKRLTEVKKPVNDQLVKLLEDLLEDARSGTLIALIGGAQRVGAETCSFRATGAAGTNAAELLYALESIKFSWMASVHLERSNG